MPLPVLEGAQSPGNPPQQAFGKDRDVGQCPSLVYRGNMQLCLCKWEHVFTDMHTGKYVHSCLVHAYTCMLLKNQTCIWTHMYMYALSI